MKGSARHIPFIGNNEERHYLRSMVIPSYLSYVKTFKDYSDEFCVSSACLAKGPMHKNENLYIICFTRKFQKTLILSDYGDLKMWNMQLLGRNLFSFLPNYYGTASSCIDRFIPFPLTRDRLIHIFPLIGDKVTFLKCTELGKELELDWKKNVQKREKKLKKKDAA